MLPRALLFSRTASAERTREAGDRRSGPVFTVQSARGGHDSDSVKSQVNTSIEFTAFLLNSAFKMLQHATADDSRPKQSTH